MNDRAFIDVELTPELADTLRLFCEVAGNLTRDEVLTAALECYLRTEEHRGGDTANVVSIRTAGTSGRRDGEPL